MTDNVQNFVQAHVPTWRERMWRKLGFRYHLGDDPADVDALEGWMRPESVLRFGLADRLRLLISGELRTVTVSHYDAPSPNIIKNRFDWSIKAPGQRP